MSVPILLCLAALAGADATISPEAIGTQINKVNDGRYVITREGFEFVISEGPRSIRIVPETRNGKAVGVRLFGIKPDGIAARVGFQNGDVVEQMNQLTVTRPEEVGEALAKLKDAQRVRFTLDRRGAPFVLEWEVGRAPLQRVVQRPAVSGADAGPRTDDPTARKNAEIVAQIVKRDDTHYTIGRSAFIAAMQPDAFSRSCRIVPHTRDGKPAGVRLFSIRTGSPLAALGFANGDIVTRINDVVPSPETALRFYENHAKVDTYRVAIERSGTPLTVEVKLK